MRAMMEEISSRIRLVFHGGILSESQISEGLENTWVLLKPQHQRTISDLGSYILQIFNLHESCPCGVLLSMDGFALPPFESTSILKDKDVISVKSRIGAPAIECNDAPLKSRPLLLANEEFNKETEGYENKEPKGNGKAKVHVKFDLEDKLGGDATFKKKKANGKRKSGTLAIEESSKSESFILANQEFKKETGGYESEEPAENGKNQGCDTSPLKIKLGEGATSKKRKTSEKLSKKKKKHRSEIMEPDIDDEVEHAEEVPLVLKREKSIHKSKKKSVLNEKDCAEICEVNATVPVTNMGKSVHNEQQISDSNKKDDPRTSTTNITAPVTIMNDNMKEAEKDNVDMTPKSDETPKRRSRSAKRKAAKRKWLREMAKIQKANADPQSEAFRNWKEMQSKPVREESAGQPNGHKSSADTESEALKYWKEMQSKSAREIAARRPNGHKINIDSQSEALRNWKEMQSKVGTEGTFVQPNHNTKWGHASVMSEGAVNKPNRPRNWKHEQNILNSGEGVSLQKVHRNWTHGQTRVKNGEDVRVEDGEITYERGEASDQLNGILHLYESHADATVKDAEEHIPSYLRNNACNKPNGNGDSDSDDETEVVPVEIKPGHIRFEPLGKERTLEQTQLKAMTNYHWNGITSKKKGQKWGTEKSSFFQRIEVNNDSNIEQSEMPDAEMHNAEMLKHSAEPFDFTKVPFLSGSPKEGDVLAYRLLELSSTWTPELSSYRVGEVSSYDSQSGVVSLMPVPEFPIPCKKPDGDDESSMQPDDNVYKEDGSLEIVFSLLAEVRILEHKTGVPGSSCDNGVAGDDSTLFTATANVQTPASIPPETQDLIHGSSENTHSTIKENDANPWDQFSEVINAKKQQLSQENSGKPLSYKSLRNSAMAPTMAFLRSIKQI